jgi:hypothetical protein
LPSSPFDNRNLSWLYVLRRWRWTAQCSSKVSRSRTPFLLDSSK